MATRLTLFVPEDSPESRRCAIAIRRWCERHLPGDYRLDVCDIHDGRSVAGPDQVLVAPLLMRQAAPARVVGDLTDVPRVMAALGLAPTGE